MATVYQSLDPASAQFLSSSFPALIKINGTNFPVTTLAYDAASTENAYWLIRAINYGSGNITLAIDWYADTASTGVVRWGAQIAAITQNTDTQDIETKAFATAQTVDDTHLGTTGQRVHTVDLVVTNLDSVAAGDDVWVKVYREGGNAADTMTGDAMLVSVTVSYSDV